MQSSWFMSYTTRREAFRYRTMYIEGRATLQPFKIKYGTENTHVSIFQTWFDFFMS